MLTSLRLGDEPVESAKRRLEYFAEAYSSYIGYRTLSMVESAKRQLAYLAEENPVRTRKRTEPHCRSSPLKNRQKEDLITLRREKSSRSFSSSTSVMYLMLELNCGIMMLLRALARFWVF